MRQPGIKICGVTRARDARLAVDLGADFIGLNFWPKSPRYLEREVAERIATEIAGRAQIVGVWVDPSPQEVAAMAAALPLDLFQFHGEEEKRSVDWFPQRVIKAIRLGPNRETIDLEAFDQAWGFLFDCAPTGVYGGTGQTWSYERIATLETPRPRFLAGGLAPDNVATAIAQSRADVVDVCSGVEATPGIKDPDLLERFFKEVHNVQTRD